MFAYTDWNALYHTQTCSTSDEKWFFISKSWDVFLDRAPRDPRFPEIRPPPLGPSQLECVDVSSFQITTVGGLPSSPKQPSIWDLLPLCFDGIRCGLPSTVKKEGPNKDKNLYKCGKKKNPCHYLAMAWPGEFVKQKYVPADEARRNGGVELCQVKIKGSYIFPREQLFISVVLFLFHGWTARPIVLSLTTDSCTHHSDRRTGLVSGHVELFALRL